MSNPEYHQNLFATGDSPFCLRQDLQFETIRRGLHVAHIIKDPVNLKYYEFDEHEIALLQQLDNGKSGNELCQWFNHRFPPLRLTLHALQSMLWRLYQQGLLVTVAAGQGRRVAERTARMRRQEWTRILSQPWVIRLPGINPGPWLGLFNGLMGWVFSRTFIVIAIFGLALLVGFICAQHEAIARMTPGMIDFFSRENLLLFASVIIVTKVLHEIGHAVAAHRFGCECHEMGVLLLAGLPSLYCDVSDAWMLHNRWQRIAVSLAGIWVETLIAAAAFIVWAASVPGVIHAVSFNIMVVCSIGTILFNANPLVRYDGYYMLMDLTGVSNLSQRSNESVVRLLMRWVLGSPELRSLDSPEIPRWCLIYGVAAGIYRVLLTFAILWGLHLALKPFSMSILVWMLASVALTFWGVQMIKTSNHQVRRTLAAGASPWRVAFGLAFAIGALAASLAIPLPWYVFGEAIMEPADAETLVTTVPGRLIERRESGTTIEAGELIAKLDNEDIQHEIQQMEADSLVQNQHLQALFSRRNQDPRAAEQIPGAKAVVAALEHRLNYLRDEQRRLELRASHKSVIYGAPIRLENPEKGELSGWTGSLLDPVNREAWISVGDAFCQIGSVDHLEAIAILAQDDLEAVSVGQRTDILLKSSGTTVPGEISKISSLELDSKDETTVGAILPRTADPNGRGKLHGKWYQVQIRCLSPLPEGTRVRSRSKVRIHVGSRTLGEWIALQFFKTFRWHA